MREFCSMNNLLLNKRDPAVSLVCSPRDDIKIYISEIETPLGPMTAIAKNEALLYLNFSDCPKLNQQINNLKKGSPDFTGRIKRQHALKENIIISHGGSIYGGVCRLELFYYKHYKFNKMYISLKTVWM